MKRVLVTGVTGFIGKALASSLVERGDEVFGIGTDPAPAGWDGLADYRALRLPAPEIGELLRVWDPEVVYHCAGSADPAKSLRDPLSDFQCGPPVVSELLEAIRGAGGKAHLVLMSSAAVYGQPEKLPVDEEAALDPVSPYGEHKRICESLCIEACERDGIRTTAARIFSAYGPGLRRQVVWDAIRKLSGEDPAVFMGTGEETRDFIHIQDLVRALEIIGDSSGRGFAVSNVASGTASSIRNLVAEVAECLGKTEDTWRFEGGSIVGIPRNWKADITRLTRLGFTPAIDLTNGISQTVAWALQEIGNNRMPLTQPTIA